MNNLNVFEEISSQYEDSLAEDFKKNNGIFYTDIELAESIVRFLDIPNKASIMDPCCGTGSFIYTLQKQGYQNVYGCDFDMKTVRKCRELTNSHSIRKMDTIGVDGDTILKKMKHKKFDFLIGNPPYAPLGKDVNLNATDDFLSLVKRSGSNLFVAAIYRAFELTTDDGYISFIVPKNLLHISSYKEIRQKLLKEKRIVSIIELGIHFKSVRGEQIVITLQNSYQQNNTIKYYNYNHGIIEFMSEISQDYYDDEIIVFTANDEVPIYNKLKGSYEQLGEMCTENICRGRNKETNAIRGKQIRKLGFKDLDIPNEGNQIFIQNIFSAEAGITASFGGNMKPGETVTIVKLQNTKMCKYVLGLLHSRVCNYFLIRFGFNNSRLTIHTDAKYLSEIPVVVDDDAFEKVVDIVNQMESVQYMSDKWYKLNEILNNIVYEIYQLNVEDRNYIENEMRKISSSKWYKDNSICTA